MNQMIELPLSELVADTNYQPRYGGENGLDPEHLEHLACSDVADWPPVLVTPVIDKQGEVEHYLIIDGFHRYEVAKQKKLQTLRCTVVPDADYEDAFAANLKNGLPLSNKDRTEYAKWLRKQYPDMGIREIAAKVGVSDSTVSRWLPTRSLIKKQASNNDAQAEISLQVSNSKNGLDESLANTPFTSILQLPDALYQAYSEMNNLSTLGSFISGKSSVEQQALTEKMISISFSQYNKVKPNQMIDAALVIGQGLINWAKKQQEQEKNEPA